MPPPDTYFFTGGEHDHHHFPSVPSSGVTRHVRPYLYTFRTHAKGRWYGRSILDVHQSEFGVHPPEYYSAAIKNGCITVNGKAVESDYVVRGGDIIEHLTHRHEPPVRGCGPGELQIIADTKQLLVVNKPASVPIHPCGAYHYNSLYHIIQTIRPNQSAIDCEDNHGVNKERRVDSSDLDLDTQRCRDNNSKEPCLQSNEAHKNEPNPGNWGALYIVHRLDRLTSGLTLLAKSPEVAKLFGEDLRAGNMTKTYLARVVGDFGAALLRPKDSAASEQNAPDKCTSVQCWQRSAALLQNDHSSIGWAVVENSVESFSAMAGAADVSNGASSTKVLVQQPISCVSHKGGVYECPLFTSTEKLGVDLSHCQNISDALFALQSTDTSERSPPAPANMDLQALPSSSAMFPDLKEAATLIQKISYNGKTSLVEVTPLHGRTHQIRLHLQYLGHPIANDPCYGGQLHYGDDTKGIPQEDPLLFEKIKLKMDAARQRKAHADFTADSHPSQPSASSLRRQSSNEGKTSDIDGGLDRDERGVEEEKPAASSSAGGSWSLPRKEGESAEKYVERTCRFCRSGRIIQHESGGVCRKEEEQHSGQLHSARIWLHAFRYARRDSMTPERDWAFQTPLPSWAVMCFHEVSPNTEKFQSEIKGKV